jgi:uncharacterized protein with HEPN domain
MRPEARKLVLDALNAAEAVSAFIGDRTFEAYAADLLVRSAVERQLEIVGEALAQLRRKDPELAARIPDLARIVAFRNILTHGYGSVDQKIVWESIGVDLDPLKDRLRAILEQDRE